MSSLAQAQSPIELAQAALANGDAQGALELARSSPERDARTLVMIGRAHAALGEPRVAIRFYRRALAEPGVRRGAVIQLLQRARAELAVVRVDLQPGNAVLEVDGEAAEWEVGERLLLLAPGEHELVARAPGRRARSFSRLLGAGSVIDVRFLLPAGDDRAPPEWIPQPDDAPRIRGLERDLILSAVGLAGAGLAATWAADRRQVAASACARGQCDEMAGVRLEEDWAALHAGLSLGILLGAQANLLLSWAAREGDDDVRLWPRLAVVGGAFAATWVAVASMPSDCEGDACGGALTLSALGAALGLLTTQVGALVDEHLPAPFGIVVSGVLLAASELAIGTVFAPHPEADEDWAASARETLAAFSFSIGGLLLAASVTAAVLPFLPIRTTNDVSVAVGPGGVAVHGRM